MREESEDERQVYNFYLDKEFTSCSPDPEFKYLVCKLIGRDNVASGSINNVIGTIAPDKYPKMNPTSYMRWIETFLGRLLDFQVL